MDSIPGDIEIVEGTTGADEDPQGVMIARLGGTNVATAIRLPGDLDRWALYGRDGLLMVNIIDNRDRARDALQNLARGGAGKR